jgi:hypothetical protein
MAIPIPSGGADRNDLYSSVTDAKALLTDINTTLVAAGWSSANAPAAMQFTWTGQPTDGQTITLNGQAYRFKNALASAFDVLIDTTADITYQNFVNAVNLGTGSGSTYHAGTTLHPTISATYQGSGKLLLVAKTAGLAGNSLTLAESVSNGSFVNTNGTMMGGGYFWTPATTPQLLSFMLVGGWIPSVDGLSDALFLAPSNLDASLKSNSYDVTNAAFPWADISLGTGTAQAVRVRCAAGANFRVFANQHQGIVVNAGVGAGSSDSRFYYAAFGVPWVPSAIGPKAVLDATNTTPIVMHVSAHGYTTNDIVIQRGILGNAGANGEFTVTVTDANHYSLNSSVGTGVYTTGGIAGRKEKDIVELAWLTGARHSVAGASGKYPFMRGKFDSGDSLYVTLFNNTVVSDEAVTGASFGILMETPASSDALTNSPIWHGGSYLVSECVLRIYSSIAADKRIVGSLWNMGMLRKTEALGTTGTFLSKNWYVLSDSVSSPCPGAMVVVIP